MPSLDSITRWLPGLDMVLSAVFPAWRRRLARKKHAARVREVLACARDLAAHEHVPMDDRIVSSVRISLVVPTYNTPVRYLADLVHSFDAQGMGEAAELILSDDGSSDPESLAYLRALSDSNIKVVFNAQNEGIAAASNAGIAAAHGDWVAFVDHDDALFPHALEQVLFAIDAHPGCRFVYTDEVIADADLEPEDIFLKPAYDEILLSGVNYINHLSCYHRKRLLELGGFRLGFDGSQDYDLLLRYLRDIDPGAVLHLPYPAYIWRRDGRSYSSTHIDRATAHARKALGERYAIAGTPREVGAARLADLHRVRFDRPARAWPRVSVIIPSRDSPELARSVLSGVLEKTTYPDLEVIVVDNGTTNAQTLALYENFSARHPNFRASIQPEPFNFSRAINRGVAMASGDCILLLNNDVENTEPDWLCEMVSCLDYGGVGVVGAKLLYPDRTVQHAGVIAGFGGLAGHWYLGQPDSFPGPMGRLAVRQAFSVVTGACFLVSRTCWERVGPLDEERFAIAYNDVDFCLRARKAGFRVVWTPFATLFHHESASRGSDETAANIERFRREQDNLRIRHHTDRFEDPAINPWFTTDRSQPELRLLHTLPRAR